MEVLRLGTNYWDGGVFPPHLVRPGASDGRREFAVDHWRRAKDGRVPELREFETELQVLNDGTVCDICFADHVPWKRHAAAYQLARQAERAYAKRSNPGFDARGEFRCGVTDR